MAQKIYIFQYPLPSIKGRIYTHNDDSGKVSLMPMTRSLNIFLTTCKCLKGTSRSDMEIRIISLHSHLNERILVRVDHKRAKIGNQLKREGRRGLRLNTNVSRNPYPSQFHCSRWLKFPQKDVAMWMLQTNIFYLVEKFPK